MFFEHNFGHNTRFFLVTLKSIILEFSSIMYLTLLEKGYKFFYENYCHDL